MAPIPILNIRHDFKLPVIEPFSYKAGSPVVEMEPGEPYDTRSFSEMSKDIERHGALPEPTKECGGIFTNLSGIISSPRYPFNYPSNAKCVYLISVPSQYTIGVECLDFKLQHDDHCKMDYFQVLDDLDEDEDLLNDRRYCGDKALVFTSHGSNLTLQFISDSLYNYQGFFCRYRALNEDGTGAEGTINLTPPIDKHPILCNGAGDSGWSGKCGVINSRKRVVNGVPIVQHHNPWMVAVLKECGLMIGQYCHICGGTVIHSRWILTGAHCTHRIPVIHLAVLLGDHNLYTLTPSQKFFRVDLVVIHPDFNVPSPLNNDVALLRLPQEMTFSAYIAPICLPPKNVYDLINLLPVISPDEESTSTEVPQYDGAVDWEDMHHEIIHDIFIGRNVTVAGWGHVDDEETISEVLRNVDVQVLDNLVCDYYYGIMTPSLMCTSGKNAKGPCQGDSGSPAMVMTVQGRIMQVAVLVFGAAFGCMEGYPSGHALLPLYVEWIEFVTGEDMQQYF
ncbi:venom serine protease 34-like [Oratosquilla oratoria]|uniref:venom serine protease 34-like n=1 Tax=Oratosquilla oratoria TaxID=337810 RepID=UPI003F7592DC